VYWKEKTRLSWFKSTRERRAGSQNEGNIVKSKGLGLSIESAGMDPGRRKRLNMAASSSPCFATTITSPWVASSICPPPLLDQLRELPGTTRCCHGHWHVVSGEELQALGPDQKIVDTAYPTDFDIITSRPTTTSLPP